MDRERQRRVKKRFGKRIRQLREARDLTQKALASACGLDSSYLGRIERWMVVIHPSLSGRIRAPNGW